MPLSSPVVGSTSRGAQLKRKPASKVIANLSAAGHGWVQSSGTPNLDDTGTSMNVGTQALSFTLGASAQQHAQKTAMTPFSVVGKYIRITFRYTGDITTIQLYLASDNALTNRVSKNLLSVGRDPADKDVTVDMPIAEFTSIGGSPDLANVIMARLLAVAGPAGGKVDVASLSIVDPPAALPNGAVILSFDDSNVDAWSVARAKLATYNFPGTLFPTIGSFGFSGSYMTLAQAAYLQDVLGWEIGAHAIDAAHHVDHRNQTEAFLRAHFEAIVAWMKANGFRSRSYAWPATSSDDFARQIAGEYFDTARGGWQTDNEVHAPASPFNLKAYNAGTPMTLAAMKAAVDRAKTGKSVAHFFFHRLPAASPATNETLRQDFYDLVDYIAAQGVPVYTQGQVHALSADSSAAYTTEAPSMRAASGVSVPLKLPGDNGQGAWNLTDYGAGGYGVHINAGLGNTEQALIGLGTDYGTAGGLLISGKNSGTALAVGQMPGSSGAGISASGWSKTNFGFRYDRYVGGLPFLINAPNQAGFPDGVSNTADVGDGAGRTFVSATAAFAAGDVGQAITQLTSIATVPYVIPAGTTITAVKNATTVVLSQAVTGIATGINFSVAGRAPSVSDSIARIKAGVSGQVALDSYATQTDAQPTWYLQSNGYMNWGPGGSTSVDTWLQRSAPGIMRVGSFSGAVTNPGFQIGSNGSKIFSGAGAPGAIANSADGDFYLRSDGGAGTTIYQRRAGVWAGIL